MECTTVFSQSNLRKIFSALVLGAVLGASWQSRSYAESRGEQVAAMLAENVVQVRAKWGGKARDGFGLVFGERSGLLYLVTASKNVRGGRGEVDRAPSVVFLRSQATPVRGNLLEAPSPLSGLAVIEVERARVPDFRWTRDVVAATGSVASNTPVWLVGSGRKWTPAPGKVVDAAEAGALLAVTGLNAIGASGAALASEHGMIGMIISDSNSKEVEAVPVDNIETSMRDLGLPWELAVISPKQDCDRLAASPDDPRRPANVPGVRLDQLDVDKARIACSFLGFAEKIPRFAFQAGRIMQAQGDIQEAEKLYAIAARRSYPAALSALGVMYETQGKEREAANVYRRAAEQGDPVGQTNLATMLRDEFGGLQKNDEEAVRLYKLAASLDYPAALASLGWMYEQGRAGGAPNEPEARRLYEKAADKGDQYAQRALMRLELR